MVSIFFLLILVGLLEYASSFKTFSFFSFLQSSKFRKFNKAFGKFCLHSTTNNNARFEPNKFILGGPGENQPEPHTFTYTILQSLLTSKSHSNTFKTLATEHVYIVNFPYPY